MKNVCTFDVGPSQLFRGVVCVGSSSSVCAGGDEVGFPCRSLLPSHSRLSALTNCATRPLTHTRSTRCDARAFNICVAPAARLAVVHTRESDFAACLTHARDGWSGWVFSVFLAPHCLSAPSHSHGSFCEPVYGECCRLLCASGGYMVWVGCKVRVCFSTRACVIENFPRGVRDVVSLHTSSFCRVESHDTPDVRDDDCGCNLVSVPHTCPEIRDSTNNYLTFCPLCGPAWWVVVTTQTKEKLVDGRAWSHHLSNSLCAALATLSRPSKLRCRYVYNSHALIVYGKVLHTFIVGSSSEHNCAGVKGGVTREY